MMSTNNLLFSDYLYKLLYEMLGVKLNYLGLYNYYSDSQIIATEYAITTNWQDESIVKKFALGNDGQGLECAIEAMPNTEVIRKKGISNVFKDCYQIVLDQHNDRKYRDLINATRAIYSHYGLFSTKQPIIRPRQYINQNNPQQTVKGEIPARALIQVEQNTIIR